MGCRVKYGSTINSEAPARRPTTDDRSPITAGKCGFFCVDTRVKLDPGIPRDEAKTSPIQSCPGRGPAHLERPRLKNPERKHRSNGRPQSGGTAGSYARRPSWSFRRTRPERSLLATPLPESERAEPITRHAGEKQEMAHARDASCGRARPCSEKAGRMEICRKQGHGRDHLPHNCPTGLAGPIPGEVRKSRRRAWPPVPGHGPAEGVDIPPISRHRQFAG